MLWSIWFFEFFNFIYVLSVVGDFLSECCYFLHLGIFLGFSKLLSSMSMVIYIVTLLVTVIL